VIPLLLALGFAVAATVPIRISMRDVSIAVGSVLTWALVACITPRHPVPETPGNDHTYAPFVLTLAALSLILIAGASLAERATCARRQRQVVDDQVAVDTA
jgi:hypothetical protein